MTLIRTIAFCMAALAAATAFAEDKPPAAPGKAEPLSFDAVLVKPEELPADVKIVEGLHCASSQPAAFFRTPSIADLADEAMKKRFAENEALAKMVSEFPKPKRSSSQSFEAAGAAAGTVLVFEYASGEAKKVQPFLRSYLWGSAKGPSPQHPESLHVAGDVILIVSFPQGDRTAEWFKSRLRSRFGVPASRWTAEIADVLGKVSGAYSRRDQDAGLKLLTDHEALLAQSALAHYMRGELAAGKKDHSLAAKGYRRAVELSDSREDPMESGLLWASLDGLGGALVMDRKLDESVKALDRAVSLGRAGKFDHWSSSLYNLACAHSLGERWDAAFAALKEAIDVDVKWKESAKTDGDLVEARKRPEFAKLLGL